MKSPKFDEVISLNNIKEELDCYDLEYIADDTFIVGCSKMVEGKVKNVLYYVNGGDSFEYLVEDPWIIGNHHLLGSYKVKG